MAESHLKRKRNRLSRRQANWLREYPLKLHEPPHCQQVARSLAVDAVPVSSAERWFNNGAYVSQFNRA